MEIGRIFFREIDLFHFMRFFWPWTFLIFWSTVYQRRSSSYSCCCRISSSTCKLSGQLLWNLEQQLFYWLTWRGQRLTGITPAALYWYNLGRCSDCWVNVERDQNMSIILTPWALIFTTFLKGASCNFTDIYRCNYDQWLLGLNFKLTLSSFQNW